MQPAVASMAERVEGAESLPDLTLGLQPDAVSPSQQVPLEAAQRLQPASPEQPKEEAACPADRCGARSARWR